MIGFGVQGRLRIKIRIRVGVMCNISAYRWTNCCRSKCTFIFNINQSLSFIFLLFFEQKAKYFCCDSLEDEELYRHYALNVPLYTHFTSPIRRYPDILVHRMLAASLGECYCSL